MLAFLGASENIAFVSAILLMLLIGVVQLVGLGHFFHGDADAHVDVHLDAHGHADILSWLGLGRLPLLMLLVVFLTVFGLVGLIGQQLSHDLLGMLQPAWLAVPAATAASLPLTGLAARGLAVILPRDQTTAIDIDLLVGKRAQILTGNARSGSPARARAEDQYGQVHYVMVEPNDAGQVLEEGETVLLVRREANHFFAISRGDHRLPRLE